MRYRLEDIAQITGGRLIGNDRTVGEIVTDSRGSAAGAGSLFLAFRGVNHDSHNYISDMANRGVMAFMVERDDIEFLQNRAYIVVESTLGALQLLAAHHRAQFRGSVVAITGSNGKTVVKEWIAQTAPTTIKLFRSPRSYNSQFGVALSLLMIEGDEDIAIIEAGISRPDEMSRLEAMIKPDITIITSIGDAHQEGFESLDQKIEEKLLLGRESKKLIYSSEYTELIPHIMYGKCGGEEHIDAAEFPKAEFEDEASKRNSQIVTALFHTLGYPRPNFTKITPVAMRLELVEGINGSLMINDSYNSDINSLTIALERLKSIAAGRATTLILSDILQSGVSSKELYRKVAAIVVRSGVNRLIGVGREIAQCGDLFHCESKFYLTTEDLIAHLTADDYTRRAILLKGNRESEFERISHSLALQSHTTTLEVDLDAMIHNLNHFRAHLCPDTKLVAMVKANSYGAGDVEVAQMLYHQGVDYLAVAFADEGSKLRQQGVTMPIIVLNADDGSFSQMVDSRLEPEIYSLKSLHTFAAAVTARGEREYPIHIKIDSGMHRLGIERDEITELAEELHKLQGVVYVSSIFSHLSSADMGDEGRAKTEYQISYFDSVSREIERLIGYKTVRHIANSAAILHYPTAHFDMCRLGIGLYGYQAEGITPISTLKTRIVQIRDLAADQKIGYGEAGVPSCVSRIATIPIGYADGLNRHLGEGAWSVEVKGEKAPIIGRICMDSTMIDITGLEGIDEGDEVIIFSAKAGSTAADIANILGTISYEVLTSVSRRVKRVYLKE